MNSVTKKSALKVLALTTFAVITLQGTAFATEAKQAALSTAVQAADKDRAASSKALPLQALNKRKQTHDCPNPTNGSIDCG
ncbi:MULTISPECIES: hypothetical protein [Pseudomonas syringae group]|uniref:hypothetical protein n=1 Tax=Pseudomonas syringae group TaxID=136849 RepID=UPI0006D5DB21|nr:MULTISPECIES: hypothetical protein [Pseudomonas syringae group]KPZ27017.1 Uncharacterized protein ALO38_04134 [Pseudomonas coronafaciens pv. zizaniae]MCF5805330.1 hypothetical protein [Pseudomonas tremae]MCF5810248.1 hypothetical protein [Pseudomonas tremae]RMN36862.1 hypothetical protein ALQ61_03936 [Pseudomonas coronafaciens pv. zizaniae]